MMGGGGSKIVLKCMTSFMDDSWVEKNESFFYFKLQNNINIFSSSFVVLLRCEVENKKLKMQKKSFLHFQFEVFNSKKHQHFKILYFLKCALYYYTHECSVKNKFQYHNRSVDIQLKKYLYITKTVILIIIWEFWWWRGPHKQTHRGPRVWDPCITVLLEVASNFSINYIKQAQLFKNASQFEKDGHQRLVKIHMKYLFINYI